MAESIVTSLIGKLGTLMSQEANLLGGVETQIMCLHEEVEWIKSLLRYADKMRRRNIWLNTWVSQIRNLAFFADDILDLYMAEVMQQQQKNIGLSIMSYPKHLVTLHKLGNQLKDINRRIENISANKSKYWIEAIEPVETSTAGWEDGFVQKVRRDKMEEEVGDVVGIKNDIEDLKTLLTKQDSPQLLVVSIVGMGGLGKTTLAKKVYNNYEVKKSFDSCAWIYVSQEYQIKDLLYSAISQLGKQNKQEQEKKKEEEGKREPEKKNDEEDLKKMLSDQLKQKSCLFVFDDVWKKQDWDKLKTTFLSNPNQNDQRKQQRVLLTTRNLEVAKHADPSNTSIPHELKHLHDEESLELFKKKVLQFQGSRDQQNLPSELKEIGNKLVAECHGLPLAIVTLGGVLSTKPLTTSVWQKTLDSVTWQLNQGQEQ